MEITEVRIKLMEDAGERLQGFCSITFDDCFVVRDLKIIGGASGPFVAMPSRKLTAHCPQCGCKNHLRAAYCNQCGGRLKEDRAGKDDDGRAKLYADIAHPINSACREMIQERVILAFREEQERAKLPGYISSYDDFDEEAAPSRSPERAPNRRPCEPKPAAARQPGAEKSVLEKSGPEKSGERLEKTKVQPAESEPRAPHKAPASQPASHTPPEHSGGFGAGIW
ncbi:MAG TPA: SpoVG family protein [Pirellulales bacterium]|nr:SpoVG family protein [Pirellulales bacterium]